MRSKIILLSLLLIPYSLHAVDYNSTGETKEQNVQMRVGAEFTKKWNCGVRISLEEELRFNLYDQISGTNAKGETVDSTYAPSFNKSYTTLTIGYAPIEYFKIDAGYTLRIYGNKGFTDHNEYLRHRVFFGVTGSYRGQYVKVYLRERALCDMRTDSVNLDEKNRYNWLLRSRLGADFMIPGQPVKPYCWAELENTLNVPEFQQKDGQQFISSIRAQAGVKWRVSRLSSLDFYYRFQYGYDRDINVNSGYYNNNKPLKLRLDEERSFQHSIGILYHLDW